jgi:hypothetical protein
MIRYLPMILSTYAALVLDSVFAEPLAHGPNFWPLPIAASAMTLTGWRAVLSTAAFGLAADCLSAGPLGTSMFCGAAAALAAQSLRTRQTVSAGRFAVFAGGLALTQPLLASAMERAFAPGPSIAAMDVFAILTSAAWTMLAAWVLAHLFKTLHELSSRRRVASRSNRQRLQSWSG